MGFGNNMGFGTSMGFDHGMGFGSNFAFSVIPIIVVLGFFLVFGIMIVTLIKGGIQWKKNNDSPKLTVDATVVTKRVNVSHTNHIDNETHMTNTSSSTWYYITFQVESGDRMEFGVDGTEYGMLVEGDQGRLTFQGTRYLGFVRQ